MTRDEALLDEAAASGNAFLRLYRWNPATLSLGRNEPAELYDLEEIARRGIPVVRRPTGGRAVWHEHELTYAVAAPIAGFGSLRGAYCEIHARLAAALRGLGAPATVAPARTSGPLSAPPTSCFAAPVGGEILVAGRKLVGSAQLRRGHVFLQHGSVLLDGSQAMVNAVSRQPSLPGETTLSAALGHPVGFEEVADAILAVWAGRGLASLAPK